MAVYLGDAGGLPASNWPNSEVYLVLQTSGITRMVRPLRKNIY